MLELSIRNIGKIQSADLVFNGITVICGENNTGKSTVGKALFCFFNSTVDFHEKINDVRTDEIFLSMINNKILNTRISTGSFISFSRKAALELTDYISNSDCIPDTGEIERLLAVNGDKINTKQAAKEISEIFSTSDDKILNEYIFRLFNEVFSEQICYSKKGRNKSDIQVKIQGKVNNISFFKDCAEYTQAIPITHKAYYIDNPFVINNLSNTFLDSGNELERNVVLAIKKAMQEVNEDKMSDIIDAVSNKEKIENIYKILEKALDGRVIKKEGAYYYNEDGIDVDFRNLSAGLKSFILIERLISSGKLKTKDILILDEPEIHLHPQWQMIYAELIVVMQKELELTVLINTHSTVFLQALSIASRRTQKTDIDFYLSDPANNSFKHLDNSDISEVYNQTNIVTNQLLNDEFDMDFDELN